MNMQYSPRTESMLDVSAYADVMRWVAQQRNVLLFDRLAIMHYWNDVGTFDLYAATNDMLWRDKFMSALAGPWRRKSSMPRIWTP